MHENIRGSAYYALGNGESPGVNSDIPGTPDDRSGVTGQNTADGFHRDLRK
jgi:hypothetical protein